jgi:predicted alpha/beta-fold hydrolase
MIVRMHGLFGQNEQEIAYGCPNAWLIWTEQAGNSIWLSECMACLDRTSRKLPMVVRMHGLFGQNEQEIANDCPNQEVIRTERAGNCLWLSECMAYSDRTSRNLPMIVRMHGLFGQNKQEFAYGCPNAWLIWTEQAGICLCCPNAWLIWTEQAGICR